MMKYREMAIEMLKLMGWVSIPTMSDSELCIPEIRVNTSAYPKRMALEKFMELNKL